MINHHYNQIAEYKRAGDVCYFKIFGKFIYRRVGSVHAIFNWVFEL